MFLSYEPMILHKRVPLFFNILAFVSSKELLFLVYNVSFSKETIFVRVIAADGSRVKLITSISFHHIHEIHTNPAKVCIAHCAYHMIATEVLLNWNFTRWTISRMTADPELRRRTDGSIPGLKVSATCWLVGYSSALETIQGLTRTRNGNFWTRINGVSYHMAVRTWATTVQAVVLYEFC